MNCNPGDLAIVVRSLVGDVGVIVTCIRIASPDELLGERIDPATGPYWRVDRQMKFVWMDGSPADSAPYARDEQLRPIRDTDGTDEVLLIAQQRSPFPVIDPITEPALEVAR